MAKPIKQTINRLLKRIFNSANVPAGQSADDSYDIIKAGDMAGINMIVDALARHSQDFERHGDTIEAGRIISKMFWSGDLQATLKDIRPARPDEAPAIAVFSMRCPQNGLYRNHVDNFHAFFRKLGFSDYAESPNGQHLPGGENWYAHFGGSMFTPGYLNKEIGHFEVAVPLTGLLQKLGIAPEHYAETVRRAQAARAAEKGVTLAPDNLSPPQRPSL